MAHTRFEDFKQRRLDRMTAAERAEFDAHSGFALRAVEHLRSDPDHTISVACGQLARQLDRANSEADVASTRHRRKVVWT